MEQFTRNEFKIKNLDINQFLNESPHFKQLFLNEHNISIPLSWRTYTGIKDNREANNYLNDLISECYRLISKISEKSKTVKERCNLENRMLKMYVIEKMSGIKNGDNEVYVIKILNDELNKYIKAVRDMEKFIVDNKGYIRYELILDSCYKSGKYFFGISEIIEECCDEIDVKNYYKQFLR